MRLLDDAYRNETATWHGRNLSADFFTVLFTSIALGIMGQFITDHRLFFTCFDVILVVDMLWSLTSRNAADGAIQTRWMMNNLVFCIIVTMALTEDWRDQAQWALIVLIVGCFLNTLIDLFISRSFYFPSTR
jgi:hypothetical protein